MKTFNLLICALFTLSITAQQSFAHGNHQHLIDDETALNIAGNVAKQLTQSDAKLGFGQLSDSWNTITSDSIKIHEKGPGYYIIAVSNAKENKFLYVLMSNSGQVYDANLTGLFPKLKRE